MALLDGFINEFDTALRSVFGGANAHRSNPGAELHLGPTLNALEREHSAGLMRVNHVGEVCAQALYQSQKRRYSLFKPIPGISNCLIC